MAKKKKVQPVMESFFDFPKKKKSKAPSKTKTTKKKTTKKVTKKKTTKKKK